MIEGTLLVRACGLVVTALVLSGCLNKDSDGEAVTGNPTVTITNPEGVDHIQTPDIVVNLVGTASSPAEIQSVEWVNDRGGRGSANGRENWVTGNIVLKVGTNNITVTATDAEGASVSKSIEVERENPQSTSTGESENPVVTYSYRSDFTDSAPVRDANVTPGLVYFRFSPGTEWPVSRISRIEYKCCKGLSGPGEGEAFGAAIAVGNSPWTVAIDLGGLAPGGTRRLRTDIHFNDGSETELRVFDFTVAGDSVVNHPPTISGSPSTTATVGTTYSFRVTATDSDGDSLSFDISNKPGWASFNRSTGRLVGTPQASDVGTYSNIRISVSDGRETTIMPAFSISVSPTSYGSALLTWTPPIERTDGSVLGAGLAGYDVHFGRNGGEYSNKIRIDNPGITSYVVENLASGRWYFSVTAIDTDGQQSSLSNEGEIVVP